MKLNELREMSIKDALEKMDLVDMKVHTDESGEIKALEIKYVPLPATTPVPPATRSWI